MANPHRGQVALHVGDQTFMLSFSVNAICALEDALDLPIAKIIERLEDPENVRMSLVRQVIWSAMQDHHPDVDLMEAGRIASEAGALTALEKASAAIGLAFPAAEEVSQGKARPPKAKAG